MKIAIVGAGIVGTTTAYELARDGHEVTVFEQQAAAAEGASFAQGGLMGSLLQPLSLPALAHPVVGAHAQLRIQRGASAAELLWRWRWQRQAARGLQAATVQALDSLAQYSRARLHTLCDELGSEPETTRGQLVLLRTDAARARLEPAIETLRAAGIKLLDLNATQARALEPGLSEEAPLACALHLPDAGAGNGRLAAQMLRQAAQTAGVQFVFDATVQQLSAAPLAVQVAGESTPRNFQAVVVCAGAAAARLLRPLGLRLPLAAVAGYAINAPLRESLHAPQGSVVDAQEQITIARLGQRVRIAGGAELGGHQQPHHEATLRLLYQTMNDWFPGGAQLSSGLQIWRGVRPMLPDGLPVLGATGIPGLWINAGHGASGWSQASGCARVMADLLNQQTPAIGIEAFALQRLD